MDTIFALATAQGKAGLAVIRISGPAAMFAGEVLAGKLPVAGRSLRKLRAADGEIIDEALVLTFPAGHSFTGEDVVELHLHGSRAVVAFVSGELRGIHGLRPAGPGEFTRRAFDNGRLDLSQVEGLADLIESETEAQRRAAIQQMSGGLRDLADRCRTRLLRATALIEATIDFADEDVPVDVAPEVGDLIDAILPELRREVQGFGAAERLRQGFEVVILGAPNAGKSTLLNAIAGREAAITSAIAGTTRDLIEVQVDLGGLPVTFVDTAGLRDTEDEVEKIGVARARDRAMTADLRIGLRVGCEVVADAELGDLAIDLFVNAKSDLLAAGDHDAMSVSGKTGEGVTELLSSIKGILSGRMAGAGLINRERHLEAVAQAIVALETGRSALSNRQDAAEIVAEHLRDARMALDRLTGRIDVEAILGEIFSSFCIGK